MLRVPGKSVLSQFSENWNQEWLQTSRALMALYVNWITSTQVSTFLFSNCVWGTDCKRCTHHPSYNQVRKHLKWVEKLPLRITWNTKCNSLSNHHKVIKRSDEIGVELIIPRCSFTHLSVRNFKLSYVKNSNGATLGLLQDFMHP